MAKSNQRLVHGARFLTLALVACTIALAAPSRGAGPLAPNVSGAGTPLAWWGARPTPIPFNPDLGTLGTRTNAQAVSDITADFGVWAAVSTASLSFTNAGALPQDVTVANYGSYFGVCGDGLSPIIFDTDGTIMNDLFGPGANNSVVAVAQPDCTDFAVSTITEGSAILNGRFLDGVSNGSNPELTLVDYSAVVIREFGHYLNLDNSQINLTEAKDANIGNDNAVATMYPFLINGSEQATLNLDDKVSVSALYPAPQFASSFGKITGSVLLSNKEGAFQGAYVIARRVDDPRISAVGAASGARFFPHNDGGLPNPGLRAFYELPGLPPGDYTVQIEAIDPTFTGAAAVGPLDPPVALPIPELWNGECPPPGSPTPAAGCESNTNPPDDPTQSTVITVTAGGTVSNINFILNGAVTGPANDACTTPTVISPAALPFNTTLSTATATTGIFDPIQSCILLGGADQNTNSVWYSFTPTISGTVIASTTGSDYDTVLAAYIGTCDALTQVGCNDDVDPGINVDSQITLDVHAGTTYLFEPTHYFGDPNGGMLHFSLAFAPPTSTPTPTPSATPTRTGMASRTPTRTPNAAATATATRTPPGPTHTPAPTATPVPTPIPAPGDANCDGRNTAADIPALAILISTNSRAACGLDDTNADGVLDAEDVAGAIEAIFDVGR